MKTLSDKLGSYKIPKIAIAVIVFLIPILVSGMASGNFFTLLGCYAFIYAIAVSGLDILFGYSGQISLGHAAYFAIGAYGSAMLNHYFGVLIFLAAIISCFLSAGIAALVAFPAAKLKFHFLSLATIAFGEMVYFFIGNSPNSVTGNYIGFFPADMSIFGFQLDSYFKYYYFALVMLVIALIAKSLLINSRTGRCFIAIRENVTAANGMGVNVRKYKVIAFSVSAFYTALAGALLGSMLNYISPTTFTQNASTMFLTMLMLGGRGSLLGPVIGALAVQLINEVFSNVSYLQTICYAFVLLIVILVNPSGLVNIKAMFTGGRKAKRGKEGSENA